MMLYAHHSAITLIGPQVTYFTIFQNDTTHCRVGVCLPKAPLSQLQSMLHMFPIFLADIT